MPPKKTEATDGATYPQAQALYNLACPTCGKSINWEAEYDADGTTYHGECGCEAIHHGLSPESVKYKVYRNDK